MEIVQRSGIYPDHSAYHVGGRHIGQCTPEALHAVVVTIPLIRGIALTVRGHSWRYGREVVARE